MRVFGKGNALSDRWQYAAERMRHNSLFLTESDLLPTNPATTNVNCRAIKGCGCLFLLHCRNGLWWLVIVNMIGNTQQDHGDGENNPTC